MRGKTAQRRANAAGCRMRECFPSVQLGGHVRIGVAILSYGGALTFGLTGDYDEAPDITVLSEGVEDSIRVLLLASSRR